MGRSNWPEWASVCFPYTKVVWFFRLAECPSKCIIKCFPFAFRMFSVWLQNAFRINRILPACWLRKVSFPHFFRFFPNAFRTRWINKTLSARFPNVRLWYIDAYMRERANRWDYGGSFQTVLSSLYFKCRLLWTWCRQQQQKSRNLERDMKTLLERIYCLTLTTEILPRCVPSLLL